MKMFTKVLGLLLFFVASASSVFSSIKLKNETGYDAEVWVGNKKVTIASGSYEAISLDLRDFYFSINLVHKRAFLGRVTFVDQSQIKDFEAYTLHLCADKNEKILKSILKRDVNSWHVGLKSSADKWICVGYREGLYIESYVLKDFFTTQARERDALQQKKFKQKSKEKLFKFVIEVSEEREQLPEIEKYVYDYGSDDEQKGYFV